MHLLTYIAISLILVSSSSGEVSVSKALAPEDIGAFKWLVGATGKDGEVVILRRTRTRTVGKKTTVEIYDSVFYDPGKRYEGTFVAIDPKFFDPEREDEPNWHISSFGGAGWCRGVFRGSETGGNYGRISFLHNEKVTIRYEFTAIVMTHAEASKLHPELPDGSSKGWTWATERREEFVCEQTKE